MKDKTATAEDIEVVIKAIKADEALHKANSKILSKKLNVPLNIVKEARASRPYSKTIIDNVLFISDLHLPYVCKKAFQFCKKIKRKYKITKTIFLGDIIDFYGLSKYEKVSKYPGINTEIEFAKVLLKDWHKEFPNAKVIRGNHIERLFKKLNTSNIPTEWLKSITDILEVPNWEFVNSVEEYRFIAIHGLGGVNMAKTVLARGKSVVQSHHHSKTQLTYLNDDLWTMQLGALIDDTSYAFDYAKEKPIPSIHSVGILYNNIPIIEILK